MGKRVTNQVTGALRGRDADKCAQDHADKRKVSCDSGIWMACRLCINAQLIKLEPCWDIKSTERGVKDEGGLI
ncbi:hypothetical protein BgiBS90_006820, partial [Biomphalaria glabrata]